MRPITPTGSSNSTIDRIKSLALELGFDHIAFTRPEIPSQDQLAYQSWCESGYAAGMDYMKSDPQKRLSVKNTYPGVQSVLTLGISYYQGPLPPKLVPLMVVWPVTLGVKIIMK